MTARCCCCGAISANGNYRKLRHDVLICEACMGSGPFCVEDVQSFCRYNDESKLNEHFPPCPSCGFRLGRFLLKGNNVARAQWDQIRAVFAQPESQRLARLQDNWPRRSRYALTDQEHEALDGLTVHYGMQWVAAYDACPNCEAAHPAAPNLVD